MASNSERRSRPARLIGPAGLALAAALLLSGCATCGDVGEWLGYCEPPDDPPPPFGPLPPADPPPPDDAFDPPPDASPVTPVLLGPPLGPPLPDLPMWSVSSP